MNDETEDNASVEDEWAAAFAEQEATEAEGAPAGVAQDASINRHSCRRSRTKAGGLRKMSTWM
jgi:hypothetical protein